MTPQPPCNDCKIHDACQKAYLAGTPPCVFLRSRQRTAPAQCNAESFRAIIEQNRAEAARKAREEAETTDNIIAVLKKRYRAEMAILDYIEMIECEVIALSKQAGGAP